jgi:hypothetical protein
MVMEGNGKWNFDHVSPITKKSSQFILTRIVPSVTRAGSIVGSCVWQNHLNYSGSSALNDRYTAGINSTHFKWNNPLVCRVSARYNHGLTGSKQVYLARRRVYNHRIAHQLLFYRYSNIITNQVRT